MIKWQDGKMVKWQKEIIPLLWSGMFIFASRVTGHALRFAGSAKLRAIGG
jgi:hypothetical protein